MLSKTALTMDCHVLVIQLLEVDEQFTIITMEFGAELVAW